MGKGKGFCGIGISRRDPPVLVFRRYEGGRPSRSIEDLLLIVNIAEGGDAHIGLKGKGFGFLRGALLKKYGKGKRVHPSAMTNSRRSWRRTKLKIKPRKTRKKHLG